MYGLRFNPPTPLEASKLISILNTKHQHMKFNSIYLPEEVTQTKGIKEINLKRLSNVVALIGKNGSGKTRILDLIEEHLFSPVQIINFIDKSLDHLPKGINDYVDLIKLEKEYFENLKLIEEFKLKLKKNQTAELNNEISNLQRRASRLLLSSPNRQRIENVTQILNAQIKTFGNRYIRRIKSVEIQELQEVFEETSDKNLAFEDLINAVSEMQYNEFKLLHSSGLDFLFSLPHQLSYDQYQAIANNTNFEDSQSYKRFSSLKKIFETLLKKELTWEKNNQKGKANRNGSNVTFKGTWKIDGREFIYKELSEGEKLLFAYTLVLFLTDQNPDLDIRESILLVDEPELHLHPDSEIDLIEGLRDLVGERGQIIFATHSINILSHLNYDEIFTVKKGQISHPSQSTIGESLVELLSLEERVNKLSDFLSSVSTWTFVNFMAECFSNPEVIESSNNDDPQIVAFKKAVINNGSNSNMMLDFGAGKGRLFEQLRDDYDFFKTVNYFALEPDESIHSYLKELGINNVYNSYTLLPEKNFDFVLLCNVLHEVPILEWEKTLNTIINSLKENGFLIIIEAKILTKGEKIGKEGFLLLDREEIQTLFSLEDLPGEIIIENRNHLISSSVIPKSELNTISKKNIKNALIELEKNSIKRLISLRNTAEKENINPVKLGRTSAFLSQLHINSRIAQLSLK